MKARLNYWIDVAIGLALLISAVSGIVFLIPLAWTEGMTGVLGISFRLWNDIHTWSSLAMVAGVALHLVLHWGWVKAMTRRAFSSR